VCVYIYIFGKLRWSCDHPELQVAPPLRENSLAARQ